eukprot:5831203-Prorocentrum_lima.AAC.1
MFKPCETLEDARSAPEFQRGSQANRFAAYTDPIRILAEINRRFLDLHSQGFPSNDNLFAQHS